MNATGQKRLLGVVVFLLFFLGLGLFQPGMAEESLAASTPIHLRWLTRYQGSGAEISAYDPLTKRLFVAGAGSQVDVLDFSNPALLTRVTTLAFDATSVAVMNGIAALAVPDPNEKTNPGSVYLYHTGVLDQPVIVAVGALPDMLTFTPDGRRILAANEGEAGAVDPEGSVSIIDIGQGIENARVKTASFDHFNQQRADLVRQGVRIFPGAASVAQDFEPESIAVTPDGSQAYVTLQENNALAVLQVATATFEAILPLGQKDHSLPGYGLDTSDQDGKINIQSWSVSGLYMPDGIAAYEANAATFLVTANEGDDRGETARVGSLSLDPVAFPNQADLKQSAALGRLSVSLIDGDANQDGLYEGLFTCGARSFSIWTTRGEQVFDSGDQFEQITANKTAAFFNAESGDPGLFDTRSDDKGPEPEGITLGSLNGKTYAFIGLERSGGGVMVFDVSSPSEPTFVEYARVDDGVGPEGLLFIPAENSPIDIPLLVVTNAVSKTVSVYAIE